MTENTLTPTTPNTMFISETATVVAAALANTHGASKEMIGDLIGSVHAAFTALTAAASAPVEAVAEAPLEPAVSIRQSVKPDYIVCLEDGKKLKMLKRHLMTSYQMTPEQYRARWGLSSDYPMVAPNYAEKRRELAKKIGLGRKPGARRNTTAAPAAKTTASADKPKRGRPAGQTQAAAAA